MRAAEQIIIFNRPGWVLSGAGLDMDFANNKYFAKTPADLTVTRASPTTTYAENTAGVWVPFSANAARITDKGLLVEESRTNSIRNNSMQGVAAGTPGTLPTNWSVTSLQQSVVGSGTENGIEYVDIRIQGTTGSTSLGIRFEPSNQIVASSGQTWTESAFLSLRSGDFTNVTGFVLNEQGRTAANATNADSIMGSDLRASLSSVFTRYSLVGTLADATTAFINPQILVSFSSGVAIDFTLRVGWPQLELGAFITSPIRTTTATVTRSADAVSLTTSPFASIASASVFIQYTASPTTFRIPWQIDDGSNANAILLDQTSSTSNRTESWSSSVQTVRAAATITASSINKTAAAWSDGDWATVSNGGSVGTNGTAGLPTITSRVFRLGGAFGANYINSYIQRIAIWPTTRIPNGVLQSITT